MVKNKNKEGSRGTGLQEKSPQLTHIKRPGLAPDIGHIMKNLY